MAEIASAFVTLAPSAKGFGKKLDSEISGDVKKSGSKLGKGFGKMFALAGGAALGAGMTSFFKTGAGDARAYQKAFDATEQIIKATGGAANVTAEQVGKMSGRLEQMSGVDDEVIQKSANLLLTFKNVRNEVGKGSDIFTRANEAALDLSAAGFGSVEGGAKMLGKALNDPLKGISALSRAGVTFTEQQKDQIKALVESGNTLKAQKIIMGEVESQVGGVAASQVSAADRAAVAWDNFRQQIGEAVLPVIDKVATVLSEKVIPAVAGFVTGMQTGVGAGGAFVSAFATVGATVASVAGFLDRHRTAAVSLAVAIGALVVVTKAHAAVLAVQAAGGLAVMIKGLPIVTTLTKAWAAVQWVLNAALSANPIGLVVVAIAALAAGAVIAYKRSDSFRKIVDRLWGALKVAGKWVADIAGKVISFGSAIVGKALPHVVKFASFIGGAYVAYIKAAIAVVSAIIGVVIRFGGALVDGVQAAARFASGIKEKVSTALSFVQSIPDKVRAVFAGAATLLYNAGVQLMSGLAAGIRDKIGAAIDMAKAGFNKLKGLLPGSPIKWGPLKSWNRGGAGKRLMALVARGIKEATPKTVEAAQEAFEKIGDKLKSTRDSLKSTLDGLRNDFQSLADSIAGAFTGDLFGVSASEAVGSAWGGITQAGRTVGQNFIDGLMAKKAELTSLLSSFKTLAGWGIDPAFLSQLFASGNGALITELAGMGQAGATGAASLFADVTSLGDELGNAVAKNDPVSDRVDETNRLLNKQNRMIEFLAKDIGKELNGAATKARRKSKGKK